MQKQKLGNTTNTIFTNLQFMLIARDQHVTANKEHKNKYNDNETSTELQCDINIDRDSA